MSIWATRAIIGWDDFGEPVARKGVVSYADGWSNHYPSSDVEKPGSIDLSDMPHWCVPGIEEGSHEYGTTGPWLRVAVSTWDEAHKRPMTPDGATVNLTPEAARALGEALIAWADEDHVEPTPAAARNARRRTRRMYPGRTNQRPSREASA